MNTGSEAAAIAREAARGSGTYFTALSAEMCWDAVGYCQGRDGGRGVDMSDTLVMGALDVPNIPEGASIGFFNHGTLVHEMISLGDGTACGNKNACIGHGSPVGWECLDLRNNWHGTAYGPRSLELRYRAI